MIGNKSDIMNKYNNLKYNHLKIVGPHRNIQNDTTQEHEIENKDI